MEDLEEFLSPGRETRLKIESFLQEMPEKFTAVFLASKEEYFSATFELLKILEGMKGVYFTVNKPSEDLHDEFEEKINLKNIKFIDCISKISGRKAKEKNTTYLDSPSDLLQISATILLESKKAADFLIFDSVSTLLLYNEEESVEKFIHSLTGRIKASFGKSFFLFVKSSSHKRIVETLSQFSDKVIIV